MPLFVTPNSNSEDAAPLREFNPCHQPAGRPDGGQFAPKGASGCAPGAPSATRKANLSRADLKARAHAIETVLKSQAAVAYRMSNEMTAEERADPIFQKYIKSVQAQLADEKFESTPEEKMNVVALARAYYDAEKGMEGYPYMMPDGTTGASVAKHRDPKTGGFTKERLDLHARIEEYFVSQFKEPSTSPSVVVTGGLPGAGKSFGIRGVKSLEGHLNINSDDIKAMLPEYTGNNAAFLHEESDLIARRVFDRALAARQNLILDVTMKSLGDAQKGITNGLAGRIKGMADMGYEVELHFTEVSLSTSVRQAVARYFEQGRFVPPDYIRLAKPKKDKANSSLNYETFDELRRMPSIKGWKHYTREFEKGAVLKATGGKTRESSMYNSGRRLRR